MWWIGRFRRWFRRVVLRRPVPVPPRVIDSAELTATLKRLYGPDPVNAAIGRANKREG